MAVHVDAIGSKAAPSFSPTRLGSKPPHTSNVFPVQTTKGFDRPEGAPSTVIAFHVFRAGL
jgi:hypothetical protein